MGDRPAAVDPAVHKSRQKRFELTKGLTIDSCVPEHDRNERWCGLGLPRSWCSTWWKKREREVWKRRHRTERNKRNSPCMRMIVLLWYVARGMVRDTGKLLSYRNEPMLSSYHRASTLRDNGGIAMQVHPCCLSVFFEVKACFLFRMTRLLHLFFTCGLSLLLLCAFREWNLVENFI